MLKKFVVTSIIFAFLVVPLITFCQIVQSGITVYDLSEGKGENPPSVGVQTDDELLVNGGFESGTFDPWYHDGAWSISGTNPHSGNSCAYGVGNHWLRQDITATPVGDIQSVIVWCRQPESAIAAIDFYYSNLPYSEDIIFPTATWGSYDVTSFLSPGGIVTGIRVWGYSGGGPDPDETFYDDISIQTAGVPNVQVTLTPVSLPIIIPAGGGMFEFNIEVANLGTSPALIDIWSMVTLPGGSPYGPLINVQDFTAPASWFGDRDRSQNVPASAPAGNYTYTAYVGSYPSVIYAQDDFPFSKSVADNGSPAVGNWNDWGESFDDPNSLLTLSPQDYLLLSAFPNPFNNSVELTYTLMAAGNASMQVYNITGELAANLFDEYRSSGSHNITWNAADCSSGIYLVTLSANGRTAVQKVILLK